MSTSYPTSPHDPLLRIYTDRAEKAELNDARFSHELPTPSTRTQEIPSLLVSTSPESPPSPFQIRSHTPSNKPNRALNESRKLLAHLLNQLQRRPMPSAVFDEFRTGGDNFMDKSLGAIVETVRGAVRFTNGRREARGDSPPVPGEEEGDNDDRDNIFSTDVTYDLMLQLKEVLVISVAQGWQIFHDSQDPPEMSSSPFRGSMSSSQTSGRRSRSRSPGPGSQLQAPKLLSQCIAVLSSIVLEDCRFRISTPRPSRPPYALQALTLDVAQFLIHTQHRKPEIISRIGLALIPAFMTFKDVMQTRLLAFFDEGVIRGALEELKYIQDRNEVAMPGQTVPSFAEIDVVDAGRTNRLVVSIQVEAAQEDIDESTRSEGLDWKPWSSLTLNTHSLQSTNSPFQPLSVYYLASLTPPLLATVLESVDLNPRRPAVLQRFYKLISAIVTIKGDAYLDVLEVVAYHTSKARRAAISLLMTMWPKAIGHLAISRPFPVLSYADSLDPGRHRRSATDHPYSHQFVPWHFSTSSPTVSEGMSPLDCRSCSTAIGGFGLLCPFCMCAVHFDCYDHPEGSYFYQYALASDPNTQKIAMHRFCHILASRRDSDVRAISRERHNFRLVNLFTLALCFICRRPLWGCVMQGLRCTSCMQFAHYSCLSNAASTDLPRCNSTTVDSSYMTIEWTIFRHSFADHYSDLFISQGDLGKKSFEEISVYLSVLWTQLQIMNNGVALGSIVIKQENARFTSPRDNKVDEFELQYLVKLYEMTLTSGRLPLSTAMENYMTESRLNPSGYTLMFDWSALLYITATIKSFHGVEKASVNTSPSLLNVDQPETRIDDRSDLPSQPFELVPLSNIRDALAYEFNIFSDAAARHALFHLHHLGFFERQDLHPFLFQGKKDHEGIYCTFPLPLGLDISNDIETLVGSVEACLLDIDLSVNETGFLLLVRKLWPNGMASGYAMRRLTRAVLGWIFAEDDSLATILRDYLAKQQVLPGVRSGNEALPWPLQTSRPVPTSSMNNGGDYVASRRALLNHYAARWLLVLHDLDRAMYTSLLYDISVEISDERIICDDTFLEPLSAEAQKAQDVKYFDKVLRLIIKLSQTSVTFSVFDDLFTRWLTSVSAKNLCRQPIISLQRLFQRETENSNRFSSMVEAEFASADNSGSVTTDPWRVVVDIASRSKEGLRTSLQWLCLFATSGVDIPVTTYMQFSSSASHFNISLTDSLLLVEAAMSSTWLKSMGRQQLQAMFSSLHSRLASEVQHYLQTKSEMPSVLAFVRQSLASCLLLYGCDRNTLIALDLIKEVDIRSLPSRRKLIVRGSIATDPIIIDIDLMRALESYVEANIDDISCLIAKFLNMFLTESPLVESYEGDNFILRNGKMLSACAWQFYGIQRPEISGIRSTFLLRVLVVDPMPFQDIFRTWLKPGGSWELRLLAVTRLFRIILDVTSPDFHVEGRQWRSSIIDIFYHYFRAMWADEREEIRLAVDTSSQTLLPAHFEAISQCWNESLTKAPIAERAKLISFLIQLRPHFPNWKLLSFQAIVEILLEDEYEQKNGHNADGPASAHLSMYGLSSKDSGDVGAVEVDPIMAELRVSIVLLSLQMIADGIAVDLHSLQKIKIHLLQIVGFTDVVAIPRATGEGFHVTFAKLEFVPELAFPCINELSLVLDALRPFKLAPSSMSGPYTEDDDPWPLLVGSIFVDVSLGLFCGVRELLSLPILTTKTMLESLMIIIYKHDLESKPLKHLQNNLRRAVRRAMELLLMDTSYELRQLALSVIQAFVKRWPALVGGMIYDSVECTSRLIISLNHQNQDVLVAQSRAFIETTLITFSSSGVFNILCKRSLDREFFVVLKHITDANAKAMSSSSGSLRDAILRDTLTRAAENDLDAFQNVLNNLNTYVEVVYHQGYTADLLQFVGLCLTNLARRTSEWTADAFDPTPLLLLPSTLIQHNKFQSRELLSYMETVLRVALLRFHVNTQSLSRILHVTSTLYRKNQPQRGPGGQVQSNNIAQVILEILADGLRMKARVLPSTLMSILEAITSSDLASPLSPSATFFSSFVALADDGLHFLHNQPWTDLHSEINFNASVAVAKMVLDAADHDPDVMVRAMDSGEKSIRNSLGLRTWNILVLAALSDPADTWGAMLFKHFHTFCFAYYSSLRPYIQSGTIPDSAAPDINHAYAAIKLWLLLAQKKGRPHPESVGREDSINLPTLRIWNELWPHFESLVNILEVDAQAGNVSPMAMLTWSSMADLFLFIRQSRCPLELETSSQIATLNRLRRLGRNESATNKFSRAIQSVNEHCPDIPFDMLVSQAGKDIIAAEKLQALDARKRDFGKPTQERHRKDMRVVS